MAGLIKRSVNGTGKTVGSWMGIGATAGVAILMKDIFTAVFMPWRTDNQVEPETFEEAVTRLRLSEEDIAQRARLFLQQTLFYFAVGLGVIAYGVSLAFEHAIIGMLMSFLVSAMAFANAFRSHFWYFQTKQRKLGCTLQEWLNGSIKG